MSHVHSRVLTRDTPPCPAVPVEGGAPGGDDNRKNKARRIERLTRSIPPPCRDEVASRVGHPFYARSVQALTSQSNWASVSGTTERRNWRKSGVFPSVSSLTETTLARPMAALPVLEW